MGVTMLRTDTMGAVGIAVEKDGGLRIENADGKISVYLPANR